MTKTPTVNEVATQPQVRWHIGKRPLVIAVAALGIVSGLIFTLLTKHTYSPGWPFEWMWASFITASFAVVLPWLVPRARVLVAILCVFVMIETFIAYEIVIHHDIPPDTVRFQLELVALVPLLAIAILSCGIAAYLGNVNRDAVNTGSPQGPDSPAHL